MIQIGTHRLLVGDITAGAVGRLMGDDQAQVIYSDPPWGPGNQKYWHTKNVNGSEPRTGWGGFLWAFCNACADHRTPDAPVLVEMGLRWTGDLDAAMAAVGLPLVRRWTITYGPRGKPLPTTLGLFGPTDCEVVFSGVHGETPTREILSVLVRPGMVVLDPCAGLGMTARVTHQLGGSFHGTELNPARLERTAAWLRREVGR